MTANAAANKPFGSEVPALGAVRFWRLLRGSLPVLHRPPPQAGLPTGARLVLLPQRQLARRARLQPDPSRLAALHPWETGTGRENQPPPAPSFCSSPSPIPSHSADCSNRTFPGSAVLMGRRFSLQLRTSASFASSEDPPFGAGGRGA